MVSSLLTVSQVSNRAKRKEPETPGEGNDWKRRKVIIQTARQQLAPAALPAPPTPPAQLNVQITPLAPLPLPNPIHDSLALNLFLRLYLMN